MHVQSSRHWRRPTVLRFLGCSILLSGRRPLYYVKEGNIIIFSMNWSFMLYHDSLRLRSLGSQRLVCCHDQFPRIRKGTWDKSDLAQPPGQALSHWVSDSDRDWFTGVSLVRFKLREGSSLSVGNYIHEWGGHKSDFHKVTQYGAKMCHATVTGVTCDTASRQLWHWMPEQKCYSM